MDAQSDNRRGAILMMAAMTAFTLNDTCMKAVTATLPLFEAIFLRGIVTTGALLVMAYQQHALQFRFKAGDRRTMWLRALGEVGGTYAFLTALAHMPLANLSAIMQSLPLAMTLVAGPILGEAVGWRRLSAVAVGFVGVLMIVRPGPEGFDVWSLLGLAAVGFVVLRDTATRVLSSEIPSVTIALYAAAAVSILGLIMAPFGEIRMVTLTEAALLVGAGVFLIIGYLLIVIAMRVGDVGVVAPFRYTALLVAILMGWAVFDDFPDNWTLAGSAVVVITGIYTFMRERKRGQRIAAPEKAPLRLR